MYTYFPSCNFNTLRPEAARRLRRILTARMPAAGCCRFDKNAYAEDQVGLYLCQACRETLEPKLKLMSLWQYIDEDNEFPLPDWSGLTVSVQDCWRDREHPEIHAAVRSLLAKMNVRVVETAENRERSVFCGDLHFEPHTDANRALCAQYPDMPPYQMPREVVEQFMREQVEKFSTEFILTCCNRCTRGIEAGGGKPVHIAELAVGLAKNLPEGCR